MARQALDARRLRFHTDGIKGGRLCGWIYRRDEPQRRLSVLVKNRAGTFVEHAADLYRADVHRAGIGHDGYCGFAVPVHVISEAIVVACRQPYRVIFRGPLEEKTPPIGAVEAKGDRLFRMDGGRQLSGWLSSLRVPDERLEILLRVDGRIAGSQSACLYRDDPPAGTHDRYHGFAFGCPPAGRQIELVDRATGQCLHRARA